MNRQKIQEPEAPVAAPKKKRTPSPAIKYLRYLNLFGIFSKQNLMSMLPFMLFLSVIALAYIANSYQAERTIREIDTISKELKTLRTEQISGSSELTFVSKQSEVAKAVASQGLQESVEAPMKIIVREPNSEKED